LGPEGFKAASAKDSLYTRSAAALRVSLTGCRPAPRGRFDPDDSGEAVDAAAAVAAGAFVARSE